MILVRILGPLEPTTVMEIPGWITKTRFRDEHEVARDSRRFDIGTWFVEAKHLDDPYDLIEEWFGAEVALR